MPDLPVDLILSRLLTRATELQLLDDDRVAILLLDEHLWHDIAAVTHTLRLSYLSYVVACVLGAADGGVMGVIGDKAVLAFCSNDDWIRELLVYIGGVDEEAVTHTAVYFQKKKLGLKCMYLN